MKQFLFTFLLLANVFTYAQNKVVPPAEVSAAFEKAFPKMKPTWTQEYTGEDKSKIRYEAQFNNADISKVAAFDKLGNLKAVETALQLGQLPTNVFHYLRKKYSLETIKEASKVVASDQQTTFEVGIEVAGKFYVLVFDKDGNFVQQVQHD